MLYETINDKLTTLPRFTLHFISGYSEFSTLLNKILATVLVLMKIVRLFSHAYLVRWDNHLDPGSGIITKPPLGNLLYGYNLITVRSRNRKHHIFPCSRKGIKL